MFRKIVTVLLCVFMLAGSVIPQNNQVVYAFDNSYNEISDLEESENYYESESIDPALIPVTVEDTTMRTETEKYFRKIDGTYEVAIYDGAVHYDDNGEWKDIDNRMIYNTNEDLYENMANKFKIKFPKTIDYNKSIKLDMGDYSIDWSMMGINSSPILYEDSNLSPNNIKELVNINSSIIYENVITNVNLEYTLSGTNIKEDIILEAYIQNYSVVFEYKLKNLELIETEEGKIEFINNNGETVFEFSDLIMYDNDFNVSSDIEYTIVQMGNKTYEITITPSDEWLQDAAYPVKIDPSLISTTTSMSIYDTYVSEAQPDTNFSSSEYMYMSNVLSTEECRGLLYFYIPTAIMDKTITYARLSFAKTEAVANGAQINAYKNTENFTSSGATWNNKPSYNTRVVDYYTVDSDTFFTYDITRTVKEWQATGNTRTTGFTFKLDENYGSLNVVCQMGAPEGYRPVITIGYEEPSGLKDYWTYTSQDFGMIGEGYISDYTGNLTWVRNEYSLDNEFMNMTLSFYHNNYTRSLNLGYGDGWRTNYNIQIIEDSTTGLYYMQKPDGDRIFFMNESHELVYPGVYEYTSIAEDGSRMALKWYVEYGEPGTFFVTTTSDINYYFDSNSRLSSIRNMKTYHDLYVNYIDSTSQKIDYIEDEAGNIIDFTWNTGNTQLVQTELKLLQEDGQTYRAVEKRDYYYDSYNNIDYIKYNFNYGTDPQSDWAYETTDTINKLEYSFDSSNRLVYAYDLRDNYKVTYGYDALNRINSILVTDEGLRRGYTTITYETSRTTYSDYEGDSIYYTFDNYGHTINVIDDYGNSAFYRYAGLFTNLDDYKQPDNSYDFADLQPNYYVNHSLLESSDVIKQQQNPINNHGFEEGTTGTGWSLYPTSGYITFTDTKAMLGQKSAALYRTSSSVYAYQSVYLKAGEYTVQGWIKNSGGSPGAYIDIIGETTQGTMTKIYASDGWEKYELEFTLSANTTITVKLVNDSNYSYAYFDNIQIVEGFTEARYNVVLNNSFEEGTTSWTTYGAYGVSLYETGIYEEILGQKAIRCYGDGGETDYFSQSILNYVTEGETYVIGAWGKASTVPNKTNYYDYDDRFFGIIIEIDVEPEDETPPYSVQYYLPFNTSYDGWQYQMITFTVPADITDIGVVGMFRGEGYAYFDNIQIYHDTLYTKYDYNGTNGNLEKITDPNGLMTDIDYDNDNHVVSIEANDKEINVDRNSTYLVEEIDCNNVRTTYEYDSYTRQLISSYLGYDQNASVQDKWFKTTTAYSTDGQYMYSMKDEFGNINYSNIDYSIGLVTGVIDATGNSTLYEYDEFGNLVSTTGTEYGSNDTIVATYEYDSQGKLVIINRDGYYYELVYNSLDQLLLVRINDGYTYENLMEYDYWEETVGSYTYYTNLLKRQTYGNDDYVDFTYNDEDRVQSVSFNGVIRFEYNYDSSGRLSILKDIFNSNIYFYSYDLAGKLEKVTDKDGNVISYTYDEDGNVNGVSYEIGSVSRGVEYYYNSTTGEYDYTQYQVGSTTIIKDYDYDSDSLKRLDNIELLIGSTSLSQVFYYGDSYVDPSMGNATNRMYLIYYKKNGVMQYYYKYFYDANQNITGIQVKNSSGSIIDDYDYYYDGFNQLVRENISLDSSSYQRTFVYNYDDQGNIVSIYEYAYTTATTITSQPLKFSIYEYGNDWGDQLTRMRVYENFVLVEDNSYTYDDSGNPLSKIDSVGGASVEYTWDGRQLTGYYTPQTYTTYSYNNEGLRVSKYADGVLSTYILDGDKIIVEYRGNDTIYYTYDQDGTLLSMNYNGSEYFYITNMQGDVIELVDMSGNSVVKYKYDAWGNIIYQTPNQTIGDINPFRYRSYYFDEDTGLYYLQSRYYDPEIGRFLSADGMIGKVSSVISHNMYTYCENNPVMYVDNNGEIAIFVVTAIFGCVFGAISGGIEAYINGENVLGGIIEGGLVGGALGFAFGTGVAFLGPMLAAAGAGTLTSTAVLSATYAFVGSTIATFSAATIGYTINQELNDKSVELGEVLGYAGLTSIKSMINFCWGGVVGQFGTVGEMNFPKWEWFGKQALYRIFDAPAIYLIDMLIDTLYNDDEE